MFYRKKIILEERKYLDYLHSQIINDANKTHFLVAIQWCQPQSESYRRKYYCLQWLQALLGVFIVVMGTFQEGAIGILITIAGGLSTLVTFALSLHKYYDSWKRYRNSLEDIKSLTRMYLSKNEPFNIDDQQKNDKRYILELDKIICNETHDWKTMRDQTTDNFPPKQ